MKPSRFVLPGLTVLTIACTALLAGPVAQAAQGEAAAPRYLIQNLGRLPRNKNVVAQYINNAGMVTGIADSFGHQPFALPFLWHDGRMQGLVPPDSGVRGAYVFGLNNLGDAVGYRSYPELGHGWATIFRQGQLIDLTPALGGRPGSGFAINDAGQVAGTLLDSTGWTSFLLDAKGLRPLTLPDGRFPEIVDMNNAGTILLNGSAYARPDQGYLYHNGNYTPLAPPDALLSFKALNDAGQIAGTRDGRAFVYSDGAFNDLPTPDGFTTRAVDINNQGWVLGELRPLLAPSSAYNFLYRDGRLYGFEDLLFPYGAGHWSGLQVRGMNDRGQIVGTGIYNDRYFRSFIATPVPESGTGALLLAGLLMVGWAARWRANGRVAVLRHQPSAFWHGKYRPVLQRAT